MSRSVTLTVPLKSISSCFEGLVPTPVCSCSREGTPNITYLSIVHYIDDDHVGLTFQFFNKTRRNIQENPRTQVMVASPETGCQYRLDLRYERTETEGRLFDRVKTRLDAIASQTGMSQVFRLRGVDVYQVLECRPLNSEVVSDGAQTMDRVPELNLFTEELASCSDLDSLLEKAMDAFANLFGHDHFFLMVPDELGKRLYTLASHGFETSGIGSEVLMGEGILGVAAERRAVLRITSMARDLLYSRAVRSETERYGEEIKLEKEIGLPGLPNVQSQLAVPLVAGNELLGVLCFQSAVSGAFRASDERLLQVAVRDLALRMALLQIAAEHSIEPSSVAARSIAHKREGLRATIKHFQSDDTIFIDDLYLIKGVAGRIFWKILQAHAATGRTDFSNKEIRLDTSLKLPDFKDNLESRLVLLRRRLQDRCDFLSLSRPSRGRIHLDVACQLTLKDEA